MIRENYAMDIKYCFKTQIVDECNLNCCGCDHFAPIADSWHQPLGDFIEMMKTLKNTVGDSIKEIELYGGEPLLHKDLYRMLMACEIIFPKTVILSIESNGLLLDSFLQKNKSLQKDTRIEYQITEYATTQGIVDRLKNKYPNLVIFRSKHTPLELNTNKSCWKDCMFNINLQYEENEERQLEIYKHCYCKSFEEHSVCLRNWKISPCPLVMCIDIFDGYFGEHFYNEENYVKVTELLNKDDLYKMAHVPCEHCKRCGNVVYGFPYKMSEKKKSEWVVEK